MKRFCTTCQSSQPEEGGYKQPGSYRGWRCKVCMERKSTSIYRSSGKATEKDVQRFRARMQALGRVL